MFFVSDLLALSEIEKALIYGNEVALLTYERFIVKLTLDTKFLCFSALCSENENECGLVRRKLPSPCVALLYSLFGYLGRLEQRLSAVRGFVKLL